MKNTLMTLAVLVLSTAAAVAQMEMPKPGPEHKKLDMFAGSWTLDGEMKPGPMGPGGKVIENETCDWMEGGSRRVRAAHLPRGHGRHLAVLRAAPVRGRVLGRAR